MNLGDVKKGRKPENYARKAKEKKKITQSR